MLVQQPAHLGVQFIPRRHSFNPQNAGVGCFEGKGEYKRIKTDVRDAARTCRAEPR